MIKCIGYRGHWECSGEYPDHVQPSENFDINQTVCKKCKQYYHAVGRPRHPTTGRSKNKWKHKKAEELGGIQNTLQWQNYLDKAEVMWYEDIKAHLINTAPAEKVLRFMSEFGQSKPMTKRIVSEVEGEQVPEGWVYVVQNPDVPHILKVGKTYPDGIPSIMSSARRFGRATLVFTEWFDAAYEAEQSIHKILSRYNMRRLGYTDCGKELFKCSEKTVREAIMEERDKKKKDDAA